MKAGDYVRTKAGEIGKVLNRYEVNDYYKVVVDIRNGFIEKHKENLFKKYVKVSSSNIIDLIEVGDYVNGHRIDFTNSNNKLSYEDKCIGFYDGDGDIILFENDIKSIVTKEQFEQMEYKVGEIE